MSRTRSRATAISEARASRKVRSEPSTRRGRLHLEHDPAQAGAPADEGSAKSERSPALPPWAVKRPARTPAPRPRVAVTGWNGRKAPSERSSPPSSSRRPRARALEHSHRGGRGAPPAGRSANAARQLGGLGGGGDHRHRVHQQLHVAIVLGLVAGEDALQPVEAAGALDVRAPLPDADGAEARRLAALSAWSRAGSAPGVDELAGSARHDARR
jgi:hypothetical protein